MNESYNVHPYECAPLYLPGNSPQVVKKVVCWHLVLLPHFSTLPVHPTLYAMKAQELYPDWRRLGSGLVHVRGAGLVNGTTGDLYADSFLVLGKH